MLDKFYKNLRDKIQVEVVTQRVIIAILAIIVIWQQVVVLDRIENQKTLFMPPFIVDKEFWVTGNRVSSSFLEMQAEFIMFNAFNVTPNNAKRNAKNILAVTLSDFYDVVEEKLDKQILYLADNQISRVFYFSDTDTKTPGKITVTGVLKESIGNQAAGTYKVKVEISYSIVQSRFWLTGLKVVEKK